MYVLYFSESQTLPYDNGFFHIEVVLYEDYLKFMRGEKND